MVFLIVKHLGFPCSFATVTYKLDQNHSEKLLKATVKQLH